MEQHDLDERLAVLQAKTEGVEQILRDAREDVRVVKEELTRLASMVVEVHEAVGGHK